MNSKAELLRQILGPLLEDYRYWFERSQALLEGERLEFISIEQQAEVLSRVKQAQAEWQAAVALYQIADNEVGIDPGILAKWHRLLLECAELGRLFRENRFSSGL
jgi:hypothetical protein